MVMDMPGEGYTYSSQSCPVSVSYANSSMKTVLSATGTDDGVNRTARVTMVLREKDSNRNNTASIFVKVVDSSAPLVNIGTKQEDVSKIHIASRLLLSGNIQTEARCYASWKVDDSKIDLSKGSLVSWNMMVEGGVDRNTPLNLYLAANVLQPRGSYVFSLSCGKSVVSIHSNSRGHLLNQSIGRG
jgi:hypothetical protein